MFQLSEERLRNDEIEMGYYGFSSTQIYKHYRESIDNRLKALMVQLSQFYEEIKYKELESINNLLVEQYQAFWAAAEPAMQKFYEDIQSTFAVPENFKSKNTTNPEDVFCESEVKKVDEEIENLEDQYMCENYFLHALEQRQEAIKKNCLPLKKQIDLAAKLLKDNMQRMENFEVLNLKRVEIMEKFLEGVDKRSMLENNLWKGERSVEKEKKNMKGFMESVKNKSGS